MFKFRKFAVAVFVFSLALPLKLFANEPPPTSQCPVSNEVPAGLDFKTRRVQPRLIEFEPFGGLYLGNVPQNSFATGARLGFRITDAITLGTEFTFSRMQFDSNSNFGRSVTSKNEFINDVYFSYAMPVLLRRGKKIQELDLFGTVGLGNIHVNTHNRFAGLIGGGIKIYFKPEWLAFRIDVNSYLYSIPRQTDSKFNADMTFTFGPSFLFVPKRIKTSNASP